MTLTLKPGFNLISNPFLSPGGNAIETVFTNISGGIPGGTTIYKLVNGDYVTAVWDDLSNKFLLSEAGKETSVPGHGVFLFLPGASERTLTTEGWTFLFQDTEIPTGFSIRSNPFPKRRT